MGSNRSPEFILRLPAALVKKDREITLHFFSNELMEARRISDQGQFYSK